MDERQEMSTFQETPPPLARMNTPSTWRILPQGDSKTCWLASNASIQMGLNELWSSAITIRSPPHSGGHVSTHEETTHLRHTPAPPPDDRSLHDSPPNGRKTRNNATKSTGKSTYARPHATSQGKIIILLQPFQQKYKIDIHNSRLTMLIFSTWLTIVTICSISANDDDSAKVF